MFLKGRKAFGIHWVSYAHYKTSRAKRIIIMKQLMSKKRRKKTDWKSVPPKLEQNKYHQLGFEGRHLKALL